MRLSRPLVLLLLLPVLSACTSHTAARPAFHPPSASALAAGPCALVGPDLVSLGRSTYALRGVSAPDDAAKEALRSAQDRVDAFAQGAGPQVEPALSRVVVMSGLVRLQSDTKLLDGSTLDDLRSAYDQAVQVCTSGSTSSAPASPSAG